MWSEQDLNFQPSFSSARRQLIVPFSVRECKFSARPQRTGRAWKRNWPESSNSARDLDGSAASARSAAREQISDDSQKTAKPNGLNMVERSRFELSCNFEKIESCILLVNKIFS